MISQCKRFTLSETNGEAAPVVLSILKIVFDHFLEALYLMRIGISLSCPLTSSPLVSSASATPLVSSASASPLVSSASVSPRPTNLIYWVLSGLARINANQAAPSATLCSGNRGASMILSLPPKYSQTFYLTIGIRVVPPTIRTFLTSTMVKPALRRASEMGPNIRCQIGSQICSNSARVIVLSNPSSNSILSMKKVASEVLWPESSSLIFFASALNLARMIGVILASCSLTALHSSLY